MCEPAGGQPLNTKVIGVVGRRRRGPTGRDWALNHTRGNKIKA